MKKALMGLLALLILAPSLAWSTGQIGEILLYKGEKMVIFSEPLEYYFSQKNPRPEFIPGGQYCTASWRGYQGTWKIENGSLYLVSINVSPCGSEKKDFPLSQIFTNKKSPILADWFTGTLRVPQGKQLQYVHMGYESVYEKDLLIRVEKGRVLEERTIDHTQDRPPSVLE